jgi:chromosome partitioning protein
MRITAITTQKGGTGKTTIALALTSGLTLAGCRALAVDADPQGNLTLAAGAKGDRGLYDALRRRDTLPYIQQTACGDVLAATPELIAAQMQYTRGGQEYALRKALRPLADRYDHIIIDCPPGLGVLTLGALIAADDVIIPAEAAIFSVQGLAQLYSTLQLVQRQHNPGLKISGIALNKYNPRALASRDAAEAIRKAAAEMRTRVYEATIRQGIAVQEAQHLQESIFENRRAKVTADLAALVKEYLQQEGK